MYYAQIKDNVVRNIIILTDLSLSSLFLEGYDFLIQVSDSPGSPSIGWAYDFNTQTFSPPIEE